MFLQFVAPALMVLPWSGGLTTKWATSCGNQEADCMNGFLLMPRRAGLIKTSHYLMNLLLMNRDSAHNFLAARVVLDTGLTVSLGRALTWESLKLHANASRNLFAPAPTFRQRAGLQAVQASCHLAGLRRKFLPLRFSGCWCSISASTRFGFPCLKLVLVLQVSRRHDDAIARQKAHMSQAPSSSSSPRIT